MAGIGENGTVIGDWMSPIPSPRTFTPSFMAEEFSSKSFLDLSVQNGNEGHFPKSKDQEGDVGTRFSTNLSMEPNLFNPNKSSSRGGLTERRAARTGFNAPTINTAQIRSANFSSSTTDIRSPYLTIPAGISPTTLLDSPVFLSNSLAQPSPTTGTFHFPQCSDTNSLSVSSVPDKSKDQPLEDIKCQSSTFKPTLESNTSSFSSAGNKPASTIVPYLSLPSTTLQNLKEFNLQAGFSDPSERKVFTDNFTLNHRPSDPLSGNERSPPPEYPQEEAAEVRGDMSSLSLGPPAEDGYNWRKYGQKQVKGSEYPRSYYKCTHPDCQVKKKVERNLAGQVTEIIYKGAHNHLKPTPNRRCGIPSSHPFNDFQIDGSEQNDSLEATPSASDAAELGESQDAIGVSSTLSNEDEDDGATHGSGSLGRDTEEEETESKRRKLDVCAMEMSAGSRAVREPRVVVQTTSEVDILDDGYRWRKYGQKVVKGNPNPRSYYKCTNPGCTVRKHVERASHDLKSVITTYEGKHNHEVPAARTSGQASSVPSTTATVAPSAPQPLSSLLRRPEPAQLHENLTRFSGPAPFATFSLLNRERIGAAAAAANFSFGMGQQGLAGFGTVAGLPPVHSHLGHGQGGEIGFVIPKGEPKEEPVSEPGPSVSNGASAYYHQLMSMMPLGPQL